jgi:hypothetical protein
MTLFAPKYYPVFGIHRDKEHQRIRRPLTRAHVYSKTWLRLDHRVALLYSDDALNPAIPLFDEPPHAVTKSVGQIGCERQKHRGEELLGGVYAPDAGLGLSKPFGLPIRSVYRPGFQSHLRLSR